MAYETTDESTPMVGRFDGDSWVVSRRPCPINQPHSGMCVTDGHVNLVGAVHRKFYMSDCTSYDLDRHTWSHMRNTTTMQANIFPALPSARAQPNMMCFENEWYAVGGFSNECTPLPILKLTAQRQGGVKSWAETDLPSLKSRTAVAEHDGWLWVAGGYKSRGSRVATVECVDTRNGAVVEMPPLPIACSGAALVVFKNKLVLFGGYTGEIHRNDLLTLDLSH